MKGTFIAFSALALVLLSSGAVANAERSGAMPLDNGVFDTADTYGHVLSDLGSKPARLAQDRIKRGADRPSPAASDRDRKPLTYKHDVYDAPHEY